MFQEIRSNDFVVHDDTAVVFDWSHAPDEEEALQEPVEGNNFGDVKREEFKNGETGEDDPIGQPFCVIGLVFGFDGFHGNVGWVGDSDDVAENLGCIPKGKVKSDEANET